MKLNTFVRRSIGYYKAGRSVYLKGDIGRGKSESMASLPALFSQKLGGKFGYVVISGPLLNPPDAVGYLMPQREGDHLTSKFTEPFWFTTECGRRIHDFDGGIILVDEADKMDLDVKKVIGEAALSGRLGPHILPKGWVVWFAGNRQQDRSGSTKEFDHLINRRMEIEIEDDLASLETWMLENKVNPAGITFAVQNPQVVFEEIPKVQGPRCTPRSLVQAIRYVESISADPDKLDTSSDTVEEVGGMIGVSAASQLFATLRLQGEMPRFEDIVANPKKVKVPQRPDVQMLVCYSLAAKVDAKTMGPVVEYVQRMPDEFAITFGMAACRRDTELVNCEAFEKWIVANHSLMNAVSKRED